MGLITSTELRVDSPLDDDILETHKPCRDGCCTFFASADAVGRGGTGPEGGLLVDAPKLIDRECIWGG